MMNLEIGCKEVSMKCPSCGEEYLIQDGIEVSKNFELISISAYCYACRVDIHLEYKCCGCEIDEEINTKGDK